MEFLLVLVDVILFICDVILLVLERQRGKRDCGRAWRSGARGNAFASGIGNWLVATFWAQLSPLALDQLTWKFYFLFAGESC
jgi:hypothetical protein